MKTDNRSTDLEMKTCPECWAPGELTGEVMPEFGEPLYQCPDGCGIWYTRSEARRHANAASNQAAAARRVASKC